MLTVRLNCESRKVQKMYVRCIFQSQESTDTDVKKYVLISLASLTSGKNFNLLGKKINHNLSLCRLPPTQGHFGVTQFSSKTVVSKLSNMLKSIFSIYLNSNKPLAHASVSLRKRINRKFDENTLSFSIRNKLY